MPKRISLLSWLLIAAWVVPALAKGTPVSPRARLAAAVPGDVRLFLEWKPIIRPTTQKTIQLLPGVLDKLGWPRISFDLEIDPFDWRNRLTEAVGLDSDKAADLLFAGPVALGAGGGWLERTGRCASPGRAQERGRDRSRGRTTAHSGFQRGWGAALSIGRGP